MESNNQNCFISLVTNHSPHCLRPWYWLFGAKSCQFPVFPVTNDIVNAKSQSPLCELQVSLDSLSPVERIATKDFPFRSHFRLRNTENVDNIGEGKYAKIHGSIVANEVWKQYLNTRIYGKWETQTIVLTINEGNFHSVRLIFIPI